MNFRTKAFLVISLFSAAICIALSAVIFNWQRSRIVFEYQEKYASMTSTVSNTLNEIETVTDQLMKGALEHLKYIDKFSGLQTDSELRKMLEPLAISDIFITDKNGKFLRATNGPIPKNEPFLFDHCPAYKEMTFGQANLFVTPFITVLPENSNKGAYKFMMAPNHDRSRVLEVGMKLGFIGRILRQSAAAYPELVGIGLYAPSGKILGEYARENLKTAPALELPMKLDAKTEIDEDYIYVWRRVQANVENCCECKHKGLTSSQSNDDYYYVLRATISTEPISAAVAELRTTVIKISLIIIIIAFFVSNLLAKWLVSNLNLFASKLQKYLESKINAEEVRINSLDEVGFISNTFVSMLKQLERLGEMMVETEKLRINAEKAEQMAQMASQVSHDIRSPLSALNLVVASTTALPEAERLLIRNATQRINDIANSLLSRARQGKKPAGSESAAIMLVSLLDKVISEKRVQFRDRIGVDIQGQLDKGYGIFVSVSGSELSRVISNLINNSVEALQGPGHVTVSLQMASAHAATICIEDNGVGIPLEVLSRLGEKGATFGKEEGFGLGLSHAKATVETFGGSIKITSTPDQLTRVILTLPIVKAPWWFVDKISIDQDMKIVSVDDDQTIHQVWSGRLESFREQNSWLEHLMFTSLDQFSAWAQENVGVKALYLVDYEFLSQSGNGLDTIKRLGLSTSAILVSSRYDEPSVQRQAQEMGVKILPKLLATLIKIEIH